MSAPPDDNPFRLLSARELPRAKKFSTGGKIMTPAQALMSTRTSYRAGLIRAPRGPAKAPKPTERNDA